MSLIKKLLIGLLFLFLLSSLTKNVTRYFKKLDFYQSYKKQYLLEKKKEITLKTKVLKYKDPDHLEKTIREELNLLKSDETAIILPHPPSSPKIISPTPLPNWQQWWRLLIKDKIDR